jgi:hypothetical protein
MNHWAMAKKAILSPLVLATAATAVVYDTTYAATGFAYDSAYELATAVGYASEYDPGYEELDDDEEERKKEVKQGFFKDRSGEGASAGKAPELSTPKGRNGRSECGLLDRLDATPSSQCGCDSDRIRKN